MPALSRAGDIRPFIGPTEANLALSCLCLIQAITTVVIDLNRTHATNPLWTGHAAFMLPGRAAPWFFSRPSS
jgi:hypothetical protein